MKLSDYAKQQGISYNNINQVNWIKLLVVSYYYFSLIARDRANFKHA